MKTIRDIVYDYAEKSVGIFVWKSVFRSVYKSVENSVWDSVWISVWVPLLSSIRNPVEQKSNELLNQDKHLEIL